MSKAKLDEKPDDEILLRFSRIGWINLCNNGRLEWLTQFRDLLYNGHAHLLGFDEKIMDEIDADYIQMKKLVQRENGAVILGKVHELDEINHQAENLLGILDA